MNSFNDLKVDYKSILLTQSKTLDTDVMQAVLLKELGRIKNVTVTRDAYGNIYATKGKADTYPTFVCHIDTVHMIKKNVELMSFAGKWFLISTDDGIEQVGIGGDDKCGIIGCLELLHRVSIIKCAFFLDEEQGCKGSNAGDLEFFANAKFAVQIDRKGNSDIITRGSGTDLCSDEFAAVVVDAGKEFGYATTFGLSTDVVALKDRGMAVSAVNLSAGYYDPHTKKEYIVEEDLINVIKLCLKLAKVSAVFPHVYEKKSYQSHTTYNFPRRSGSGKITNYTRLCYHCDKRLSLAEEIDQSVCKECVESFFALKDGVVEIIREPDGTKSLIVVEKEVEKTNEKEDTEVCANCCLRETAVDNIYCERCLHCVYCGLLLDDTEIHAGSHESCRSDFETPGVPGETHYCTSRGCSTEISIGERLCRRCKHT